MPVSSAHPKVIAAIPCYNENQFIGSVVTNAKEFVDQVLVVDDGSTDETAKLASAAGGEIGENLSHFYRGFKKNVT